MMELAMKNQKIQVCRAMAENVDECVDKIPLRGFWSRDYRYPGESIIPDERTKWSPHGMNGPMLLKLAEEIASRTNQKQNNDHNSPDVSGQKLPIVVPNSRKTVLENYEHYEEYKNLEDESEKSWYIVKDGSLGAGQGLKISELKKMLEKLGWYPVGGKRRAAIGNEMCEETALNR
ncbi:MAG: hypothetical protein LBI29_00985 [Rickettsiales bacterium]|jgi:hypothetical protein|nr:hypothetical protein [Rickettsiales bacterium]